MEPYDLPYEEFSGYKWYMTILFLFYIVLTGALAVSSLTQLHFGFTSIEIFKGLVFLVLSLFLTYTMIATSLLRQYYIELTSDHLRIKLPFRNRTVRWDEILDADILSVKGMLFIGVLLVHDKVKKRKRTFLHSLNSVFGQNRSYSFQIPTSSFKELNPERLLVTIKVQKDKNGVRTPSVDPFDLEEEQENSFLNAIMSALILSVLIGVVYGYTMKAWDTNLVIIPIFGAWLIIAMFNRFYVEDYFNISIRLLLGLLCFLPIPIAIIETTILEGGYPFTWDEIVVVASGYLQWMIEEPLDYLDIVIVSLMCFAIGAIQGRPKNRQEE